MPRIELIDPVYYAPSDPYHWEIDNVPLKNIIQRQNLINFALDNALEQMRDAIGTQGSVANRLNQSLNANGSLKTSAVDEALHSIEEHEDTDDFVRMTKLQSDKLDLIASEATNLEIGVSSDGSAFLTFDGGVLKLMPSDTVTPRIDAPNELRFDLAFPAAAAHRHFYGLTPVHVVPLDPDYINYKVTSVSTPYIDESLRIYINGVRIFEEDDVYVPGNLVDDPWTLLSFTSDATGGTFALSTAISDNDIIKIDFDISFV
jgi:hypothetical protein